jgi:hypothetical protein
MPLNPNELCAVVRVLESLATSGYAPDVQRPLLVPDVEGMLVPASRCFLCDDGALLHRVDAMAVHLSSPLLTARVCASIGVRVLSAALEERLDESKGELMYVRGEGEQALTERLVSTELAEVVETLCAHESVTAASAHAFLVQFKVRVARSLRTVLLLPTGENVTANEGGKVMYFVDQVRFARGVCATALDSSHFCVLAGVLIPPCLYLVLLCVYHQCHRKHACNCALRNETHRARAKQDAWVHWRVCAASPHPPIPRTHAPRTPRFDAGGMAGPESRTPLKRTPAECGAPSSARSGCEQPVRRTHVARPARTCRRLGVASMHHESRPHHDGHAAARAAVRRGSETWSAWSTGRGSRRGPPGGAVDAQILGRRGCCCQGASSWPDEAYTEAV